MYVMVIMILYLQRYLQIGQTTFQFSNQVETYQAITKDGKQFLYMALVIKMIQVMKIKLMLIHQAKVKKGYILVFYMARIVNPQSRPLYRI